MGMHIPVGLPDSERANVPMPSHKNSACSQARVGADLTMRGGVAILQVTKPAVSKDALPHGTSRQVCPVSTWEPPLCCGAWHAKLFQWFLLQGHKALQGCFVSLVSGRDAKSIAHGEDLTVTSRSPVSFVGLGQAFFLRQEEIQKDCAALDQTSTGP